MAPESESRERFSERRSADRSSVVAVLTRTAVVAVALSRLLGQADNALAQQPSAPGKEDPSAPRSLEEAMSALNRAIFGSGDLKAAFVFLEKHEPKSSAAVLTFVEDNPENAVQCREWLMRRAKENPCVLIELLDASASRVVRSMLSKANVQSGLVAAVSKAPCADAKEENRARISRAAGTARDTLTLVEKGEMSEAAIALGKLLKEQPGVSADARRYAAYVLVSTHRFTELESALKEDGDPRSVLAAISNAVHEAGADFFPGGPRAARVFSGLNSAVALCAAKDAPIAEVRAVRELIDAAYQEAAKRDELLRK